MRLTKRSLNTPLSNHLLQPRAAWSTYVCRTGDREEAERYLIFRLEQIRQQKVYDVKTVRIWREAATRFLLEFKDQPSIKLSAHHLSQLDPFIGDMPLTHNDDQALVPFIKDRLATKTLADGTVKKQNGQHLDRACGPGFIVVCQEVARR